MSATNLKQERVIPTNDRWLSALAHASILLPGAGIFVPLVVWCKHKEHSQYVRYQSLQALLFQLMQWVWIQLIALFVFIGLFIFIAVSAGSDLTPDVYSNRILSASFVSSTIIAISWGAYQLIGIVGGIICLTGRDFMYPLLGRWMIRFISRDLIGHSKLANLTTEYQTVGESISEGETILPREEMLVSAAAHGSILIPLIGFLVPLVLFLMDKNQSFQNRFQLIQALAFQAVGQAANVVFMTIQMLIVIGIGISIFWIESSMQTGSSELAILAVGLLAMLIMVITIISLLFFPLLATFGIIASIQVIRGRQYRYPILGNWMFNKMRK